MGVIPSLPPYAHLDEEAVRCVAHASVAYGVPELLMHSILLKEDGRPGRCSINKNGTKDCGLGQINTAWKQSLERSGVPWARVQNEVCTNIYVSAYILKSNHARKNGDWFSAIVSYNIGPNNWTKERYSVGHRYATDVVSKWRGLQAWVDQHNPQSMSSSKRVSSQSGPKIFEP